MNPGERDFEPDTKAFWYTGGEVGKQWCYRIAQATKEEALEER